MVNPNFSIIIPNYNGKDFLFDCLDSLKKSISNCPNSNFEIILVDNASVDNSIEISKKIFPKIKIIKNQSNYGFSSAVNQGILHSKYDFVVICNNDLTLDQNWFKEISKIIVNNKDPKIATFFGTVLNKDSTKIESQGIKFYYSGKAENINNGKEFNKSTIYNLRSTIKVWGASASLVIYNKKIIKKIGLFDEDFFAYEEDVDLALRLHNLNYKTLYIANIFSYHLGGGTSNKMGNFRNKMDAKNWIYIIIKNFSAKEIFENLFKILEERLRNLSGLIKNTPPKLILKSLFDTYKEVFINLPKMLKKRRQIQKMLKYNS
jgi:GT2 family glycosyltransferase